MKCMKFLSCITSQCTFFFQVTFGNEWVPSSHVTIEHGSIAIDEQLSP
jgi:hypothetical protein